MTNQTDMTRRNHQRAVRFFWGLLFGATTVSLIGNIAHAVLPYLPRIAVQIGAAAVPPIALLAAVHGVALAVRAGASGRVYGWAVSAVTVIGVGAFAVSFLALRDLMRAIGYSAATAWIFPAIIDTAVAVSTLMLVALGDKPARRIRSLKDPGGAVPPPMQRGIAPTLQGAKSQVRSASAAAPELSVRAERGQTSASGQRDRVQTTRGSVQTDVAQGDEALASELIASRATTQPVETVIAVLAARRSGATINAAAKAVGINYRTAQRIAEAAAERRQTDLVAAS
jgi:hypothetical protein